MYFQGNVQENFDAKTLQATSLYLWDKSHVYFLDNYDYIPLEGADPSTFRCLEEGFAKDKNHVYDLGKIVPEMDPSTFTVIGQRQGASGGLQIKYGELTTVSERQKISRILKRAKQKLKQYGCNSIFLSLKPKEKTQSLSHFGGIPHLPREFTWPHSKKGKPLSFLAQFDLSEASPFDKGHMLPSEGLLSFFYANSEHPWGEYDEQDLFCVYYFENINSLVEHKHPETLEEEDRYNSCNVTYSSELSYNFDELPESVLSDEEREIVFDSQPLSISKLLGHANTIQGPMEPHCGYAFIQAMKDQAGLTEEEETAARNNVDKWILLLQVDYNDELNMIWGDVGKVYYWIRKGDLEKRDFSNVWLQLQCH